MNTKCKNCKKILRLPKHKGKIIYPIGGIIFCLALLPKEKNLKVPLIGFVTAMGIISILIMIFMFYALIKIPTMID